MAKRSKKKETKYQSEKKEVIKTKNKDYLKKIKN